ncbi:MAG: CPBP family intramembrane glutamic endopeptidase [Candidatus Heimdallarchaeota archaeon]
MVKTKDLLESFQKNEHIEGFAESIQSLGLFLLPILVILPFYVFEKVNPTSTYYIVYSIYIIGSFIFLKVNRRKLHEIGITVKNTFQSSYMALALVAGFGIARFIATDMQIVQNLSLQLLREQLIYNFIFSGFGQEILFRGVMFFSMWRWKGVNSGLIVSSVLFGAIHITHSIRYVFVTACFGAYWGYVASKTKNIIGPVIAHGLFNFLFSFFLVII